MQGTICSLPTNSSAASTERWIEDKRVAAAAFKRKEAVVVYSPNITFCKGKRYLELSTKYTDNVSFAPARTPN